MLMFEYKLLYAKDLRNLLVSPHRQTRENNLNAKGQGV